MAQQPHVLGVDDLRIAGDDLAVQMPPHGLPIAGNLPIGQVQEVRRVGRGGRKRGKGKGQIGGRVVAAEQHPADRELVVPAAVATVGHQAGHLVAKLRRPRARRRVSSPFWEFSNGR